MKTLALNKARGLYVGTDGNLAILGGIDAVMQNCETAMLAQLGEMIFAMDQGIPTRGTVWDGFNPIQFIAHGRTALLAVPGVTRVTSFEAVQQGDVVKYTASIETIYGPSVLSND